MSSPARTESTTTVRSADGTQIACTLEGSGPPLIMVHCVGVSRATTPQPTLRTALAEHASVLEYDRRGKGLSGGGVEQGAAVLERELEDLQALIDAVGGEADLYGFSSGATLALLAGLEGLPVRRLAVLEPPLMPDDGGEALAEFQRILAADGEEAAHTWFDTVVVGVPEEVLAEMMPYGEEVLRATPTLAHELTFLPGTDPERFADLEVPTRVLLSDRTDPSIGAWADALAAACPAASAQRLPGEWHGVDDATLAAAMHAFLHEEEHHAPAR